ncbi:MAG: hypothetical protein WBV94_14215 [Blastocatellia bacterium]
MRTKLIDNSIQGQAVATAIKSWTMIALTFVFVLLYGSALLGWIKPLADERMVSRLEPIIFVIIGYYFGRLPSQQNETLLKYEINRQTQKADAAQHAKEQAQQARESLEEKMKNVRTALATTSSRIAENSERASGSGKDDNLRQSVAAALNILNS